MILISYITDGKETPELINNNPNVFVVRTTQFDPKLDYYGNLASCALDTEMYVMERGGLWTKNIKFKAVVMIWGFVNNDVEFWQNFIDNPENSPQMSSFFKQLHDIRGDELVFNTFDDKHKQNWVAGHPRAIVTWSSGVMNFTKFKFNEKELYFKMGDKNNEFFWWGRKLNLKIYTLLK